MNLEQKLEFLNQDRENLKNMKKRELREAHKRTWRKNGLSDLNAMIVELVSEIDDEDNHVIEYTVHIQGEEEEEEGEGQKQKTTKQNTMDVVGEEDIEEEKSPNDSNTLREIVNQSLSRIPKTIEMNKNLYSLCYMTKKVSLDISNIGSGDLKDTLRKILSGCIEGKCLVEGYVRPNSCTILTYSSGFLERGNIVVFTVLFQCEICFPVRGMPIVCKITNITDAGIVATLPTKGPSPVVIFIARDHYINSRTYKAAKLHDEIKIKVIGHFFELNDEYISVLGGFF
jgi:hypothetical protein